MGPKDHLCIEILVCWTGTYLHFPLIYWLHVMLNVIFTCIMSCNWTIFYIHISELFPRDNHWTWWSTTAWGYLWYHVNTDFTHTVSGVPCVVEQRTLDCSMRAFLLSPLLPTYGIFPFQAKFSSSWIDLQYFVWINAATTLGLSGLIVVIRSMQNNTNLARGIKWQ